ncbi:MAG: transporter [Cytophagales bacterium]|nr:transporter [Cytophagales bacterium]
MTDIEFDILDELYFLQSYDYLLKTLKLNDNLLKRLLLDLIEKGWVKCYGSPTEEEPLESPDFEKDYWNYHYLATKAGLLAHNSNF